MPGLERQLGGLLIRCRRGVVFRLLFLASRPAAQNDFDLLGGLGAAGAGKTLGIDVDRTGGRELDNYVRFVQAHDLPPHPG